MTDYIILVAKALINNIAMIIYGGVCVMLGYMYCKLSKNKGSLDGKCNHRRDRRRKSGSRS